MMDDSKLKELLQKGNIETSNAFMDNLMNKVEAIDASNMNIRIPYMIPLLILGGLLILIALLILRYSTPVTSILESVDFSLKYPLIIITSLFLILSVNRIITLQGSFGKNQII